MPAAKKPGTLQGADAVLLMVWVWKAVCIMAHQLTEDRLSNLAHTAPDRIEGPVPMPAFDPVMARAMLDRSTVEALEFAQPPVDETPYRDFVRALQSVQPFKVDFEQRPADMVLSMLADQILGPGAFRRERDLLAGEVIALQAFVQKVGGGGHVFTSLRTYFAPGDLVWHVDRSLQPNAIRVLRPMGRAAGMRITSADNIDSTIYKPFMRRELPLLCELDRKALATGLPLEDLWGHRPVQTGSMMSGRYAFLRDPDKVWEIQRDAMSIHRFETPYHAGTYHRSSWENRMQPGLQLVMTSGAG